MTRCPNDWVGVLGPGPAILWDRESILWQFCSVFGQVPTIRFSTGHSPPKTGNCRLYFSSMITDSIVRQRYSGCNGQHSGISQLVAGIVPNVVSVFIDVDAPLARIFLIIPLPMGWERESKQDSSQMIFPSDFGECLPLKFRQVAGLPGHIGIFRRQRGVLSRSHKHCPWEQNLLFVRRK